MKDQIIHLGKIWGKELKQFFLKAKWYPAVLLKNPEKEQFCWFVLDGQELHNLSCCAESIGKACANARRDLALYQFKTINCGHIYDLMQRDEIGTPALFSQMIKSQASSNGKYFDTQRDQNVIIENISDEALEFLYNLNQTYLPIANF